MPTKAELEAELEAAEEQIEKLERSVSRYRAKAKKSDADEPLKDAATAVLDCIRGKSLEVQVGQKQVRVLAEALGVSFSAQ